MAALVARLRPVDDVIIGEYQVRDVPFKQVFLNKGSIEVVDASSFPAQWQHLAHSFLRYNRQNFMRLVDSCETRMSSIGLTPFIRVGKIKFILQDWVRKKDGKAVFECAIDPTIVTMNEGEALSLFSADHVTYFPDTCPMCTLQPSILPGYVGKTGDGCIVTKNLSSVEWGEFLRYPTFDRDWETGDMISRKQ